MQWFCPKILAWIDSCVDLTHQNWNHSCSNATACVQQVEIHGNCGSLNINIFPDPFTPESPLLVFKIICLHDEDMNHITKRHILHKVKRQNANRPCQWFCNPQFRVVIFLSLQKAHIIFWSIDLQDIVRLWHKVNDMICPPRFHLWQRIQKVETKEFYFDFMEVCSWFFHVRQETKPDPQFYQVTIFHVQFPTNSPRHWKNVVMYMVQVQYNHFTWSHLQKVFYRSI